LETEPLVFFRSRQVTPFDLIDPAARDYVPWFILENLHNREQHRCIWRLLPATRHNRPLKPNAPVHLLRRLVKL
jgi:hypothetical protein